MQLIIPLPQNLPPKIVLQYRLNEMQPRGLPHRQSMRIYDEFTTTNDTCFLCLALLRGVRATYTQDRPFSNFFPGGWMRELCFLLAERLTEIKIKM